jgi:tetratricopeptide (TPR) repeat protein
MSATKVLTTLAKLALACAVLAVGWMMASPGSTATWPLWGQVQSAAAALTRAFPLERPAFAAVILLFGAASLLASAPLSVKARSRPKSPAIPGGSAVDVSAPVEAEATAEATPLTEPAAAEFPEAVMVAEPAPDAMQEPVSGPVLLHTIAPEPAPEHVRGPLSLDDEEYEARQALAVSADAADRSRLADLLKKRGDVAESEGRLDEAMSAYEESIALRREVLVASPEDAREQRWLWTTLESLAECREDRGHRTRAAALFRESVSAGIRAVALAPQKAHYPQELQETRARLAALEAQLAV